MSQHDLAMRLPLDDRPPAYQPEPAPEIAPAPPASEPIARPDINIGATLETAAIGDTLVAASMAYADMKRARDRGSVILYRNAVIRLSSILNQTDLASLSRHLVNTIAPGNRRQSATKGE